MLLLGMITLSACGNDSEPTTLPQPNLEDPTNPTGAYDDVAAVHFDGDFETIPDEHLPNLEGTWFETLRTDSVELLQLSPLTPGEELVVLHTTLGDITLRFFPGEAPIAVENFLTHARDGFYDGLIFHRVISDFMIQSGCSEGTGMAGRSIWGHDFGVERSFNLRHFRGALAMAHAGGRMGSQFYIVQSTDIDAGTRMRFEMAIEDIDAPIGIFDDGSRLYVRDLHTVEEFEHFFEHGGTPFLDWHWNEQGLPHTVFGHVVDGMDVVDAIANVPVIDPINNHRPIDDVIIERISFIIYG